jgi:hypothetical protein
MSFARGRRTHWHSATVDGRNQTYPRRNYSAKSDRNPRALLFMRHGNPHSSVFKASLSLGLVGLTIGQGRISKEGGFKQDEESQVLQS